MSDRHRLRERLQADPGTTSREAIDMRFIIALGELGTMVGQDLPKEAFIDLDTLKEASLRHPAHHLDLAPWQQRTIPTKEVNLQLLAKVLKIMLKSKGGTFASSSVSGAEATIEHTLLCSSGSLTVPSLPCAYAQLLEPLPEGPNGEERTEVEHTVFKKSLSNMMEWYAHPLVYTFKLTRLPKGYPTGLIPPGGAQPGGLRG